MTLYPNSKYQIHQPECIPPGIFGETYVVTVGIHTIGEYFKGEYYVLSKRTEPALQIGKLRFNAMDVPSEILTVDLDFMLSEGRQFAENILVDRLYQKAEQLNKPDLLGLRINLVECKSSPLVGCWVRNDFHNQIVEIMHNTECEALSHYLELLSTVQIFVPA